MNFKTLSTPVMDIARLAGAAIMEIYQRESFGIDIKSDNSPLTEADQVSNDIICSNLKRQYPDIPIISEELKNQPYEVRCHYNTCWLIDPLDGTKEFIKRNGEFTVNIALIVDGNPSFGVVYVPVTDTMYWGGTDQGSYKIFEGKSQKLRARSFSISDKGLKVVASRSHLNEATEKILSTLVQPSITSRGSSLKFLTLAEGGAEFYPRIAPTMEWDTAAAHAILKEAGGMVIEQSSGQPLKYNKENLLNPYFIAAASVKEQADELLDFLSR